MNEPTNSRQGKSSLASLLIGGVVGFAIATFLMGIVGFVLVKKKEADVRRGWNLVPMVVAAQDIPEGTIVTFDMISQRSAPEQFVTPSVVKPHSADKVVGQKVRVALQQGDPLFWSHFQNEPPPTADVKEP